MRKLSVGLLAATLACAACGNNGNSRGEDLGTGDGTGDGGDGSGGTGTGATGTGDGGDGGTGGGEAGNALEKLIAAECGWLFDCCKRGELDVLLGPFTTDAGQCKERVTAALAAGNTQPPIQAGPSDLLLYLIFALDDERVEVDDAAIDACVAELSARPCNEPDPEVEPGEHCTPEVPEPDNDACAPERLFLGKQAAGDECTPSQPFECIPGLRCIDFGELGVCAEPAAEGDYCFADSDCTQPLLCDFEVGQCATGSDLGETCAYVDPEDPVPGTESKRCQQGFHCDPVNLVCVGSCAPGSPCVSDTQCPEDHVCVLGSCRAPGAGGAECGDAGDCRSGVCDFVTSMCDPVLGPGEACTIHTQCSTEFCHPSTRVCSPQQNVGQPCSSGQDAECLDGFCNTSTLTCGQLGGNGDVCDFSNPCQEDFGCVGGTCSEKPLLNGSPCVANDDCVSGLCWLSSCDAKSAPGAMCASDGSQRPCQDSAYCELMMGSAFGTCRNKVETGVACEEHEQCWGQCVVAWGRKMCDSTPESGTAWCDGE